MKKYIFATVVVVFFTVFFGKIFYDDHYKDIPPYDRPDTIITRFMENMIWNVDDYRDNRIQNWMEDNIRDADRYQCELIVRTAGGTNPEEHYLISVSAADKTVMIENMQNGQVTYLQVTDSIVSYYYPEDAHYAVKTFEGTATADAFSALIFPSDLRFLGRSLHNTNDAFIQGRHMVFITSRQIDIAAFYAPFETITGEASGDTKDYFAEFNDHTNIDDSYDFAFKIAFTDDMSGFLTYAYEALNGEGTYHLSDSSYVQTMTIFFYDDLHDFEDIKIPNIQ